MSDTDRRCSFKKWVTKDAFLWMTGWFHQWGTEVTMLGGTCFAQTIGIVENDKGVVHKVDIEDITFGAPQPRATVEGTNDGTDKT